MKIIAIEQERAGELYQEGVIREIYFMADDAVAVLVLVCTDLDEARD